MSGILYIVATPIGNLEDITLRALRILKEVDLIAAEDTRHTKTLLNHYGIHTPLTSYHDHNEKTKAHALVARLEQGENVALVSDAGTPTLSDPGYRLVRESVEAGVNVTPVPGASALTAVLSASGLPTDRFVFEGFLSAKKRERRERLQGLREESRTLVFYEAPHRLKGSLQDLLEVLGDREVVLGREVTKIYEEFIRGRLSEVTALAGSREWRGEITLVVKGSEGRKAPADDLLTAEIQRLRRKGMRVKEIAELLGERFSYPKREVYRLALEREEKSDTIP
ncbi:MAG: 16S rRNA (cytidine(1402)-2'-O)-methyltransferase [Deltaproteobacteria bacterium]|nr:16S rRNA (cytidine(1402)-2'-O)-methyltransferase [Deltaproteobacteria bacterium]